MAIPPYMGKKVQEYYEREGKEEEAKLQELSNKIAALANVPCDESTEDKRALRLNLIVGFFLLLKKFMVVRA